MVSKRKALSIATLVLPWLTVPFLGKKAFIRYFPVATFVGFFFALFSEFAAKNKLWKVKNALFPGYVLDISYLFGLYFIIVMWIFKKTFGNFTKYIVVNIIFDFIFTFFIVKFFIKIGNFKFKKMKPIHFYIMTVFTSIIIYYYQYKLEQTMAEEVI